MAAPRKPEHNDEEPVHWSEAPTQTKINLKTHYFMLAVFINRNKKTGHSHTNGAVEVLQVKISLS